MKLPDFSASFGVLGLWNRLRRSRGPLGWFQGIIDRLLGAHPVPDETATTEPPAVHDERPTSAAVHVRHTRIAIGIGVNEYTGSPENALRGCVNDARNVRKDLEALGWYYPYGLLLDRKATKRVALERLGNIVSDLRSGEVATVSWSSHGTLTFDPAEPDASIEAVCPTDAMLDYPHNLVTWRDIGGIVNGLAPGSLLAWLSDACHSAPRPADAGNIIRALTGPPESYRRPRTLTPPANARVPTADTPQSMVRPNQFISTAWTRMILWSGCRSDETSADAFEDGQYQGAMTWSWRRAIKRQPGATLYMQHDVSLADLATHNYEQHPQLVGAPMKVGMALYGRKP